MTFELTGPEERRCKYCDKPMPPERAAWATVCSHECSRRATNRRESEARRAARSGRICPECKGSVPDEKPANTIYCSRRCCQKGRKRHSADFFRLSHAQESALLRAQGDKCPACGRGLLDGSFVADHIVPVALGGPTVFENCQLMCARCNSRKGARREKLI